ncbi:MAG: hypothetical protein ACI8PZ_004003 [Myxococcota bacterium]|jgi:hypothetical protein
MVYVSLLLLLLGVVVLSFVYAAGHKTPLPRLSRPEILWIPGLGLLVAASLVYITPSVFQYNRCVNACDAMEGVPGGYEWAAEFNSMVPAEYKQCVDGSTTDRKSQLVKMLENDPSLDVQSLLEAEKPDIWFNCHNIVVGRCVRRCYAGNPVME